MRTLLVLVRKDLANFVRNRTALVLTFVIPIALIFVMGYVFGLSGKTPPPAGIQLAVVNESDNPAAQKLIDALSAESAFRVVTRHDNPDGTSHPLTEADARALIYNHDLQFALIIPRDLISDDRIGMRLKTLSDPRNQIEAQMTNGLLQKTIFSSVPDLLGQSLQSRAKKAIGERQLGRFNSTVAETIATTFGGDKAEIQRQIQSGNFGLSSLASSADAKAPADAAKKTAFNPMAEMLRIEDEQVSGKQVKNPNATRIIGGYAIMFLLFAVSGSSAAFFDEKNSGIFQRLLSSPVTRSQLLCSRFIYGIVLGLVQLTTLFIAGSVLYHIDVLSHVGPLLVVCFAAAASCASFGMLIAALAPNAQAASGLATFIVMMMSATGGAWFPLSIMPEFMQKIGKLTIVYWSVEGFQRVLWAGDSLVQLLPIIGILLGITTGVMAISIWRLNRKPIFG